jgi:phosphoribosylaminoimidazolecarboxamide formyltransferase/IMP cyclohydrolase
MKQNSSEIKPVRLRRALFSCWRKDAAVVLAQKLHTLGVELLASGGTADALAKAGLPVERIAEKTGFDQLLGGRVKTLHPAIYAAILSRLDSESDTKDMAQFDLAPVDLVVVDLYPFTDNTDKNRSAEEAIELIDIGGVSLIRAASKNLDRVAVLARAEQFDDFGRLLDEGNGILHLSQRRKLAADALSWTSYYDACIAKYLSENPHGETPSEHVTFPFVRHSELRYGENPHQAAGFYQIAGESSFGISAAEQLGGKQLSFNNLLDLDIALRLPREFSRPAVAILKHTTPCGVGLGENLTEAFLNARSTDPQSAYGGIAGFNGIVGIDSVKALREGFMEVVVAPGYTEDAIKELNKSKNLRVIRLADMPKFPEDDMRSVCGGILWQRRDAGFPELDDMKVVTALQPDDAMLEALKFAWISVRYVKSNAILIADDKRTIGIGAGQMSRVDAAHIAVWKAGQSGLSTKGTVAASDAYFPFRDGMDVLADAGVTAIIQPGGSIRDAEVIAAANERGIVMILTGRRHFRH